MEVKGAKILVTGGSDGYGRGIAKVLKNAGAEVWITGRSAEKLKTAAKELDVHAISADASSASSVSSASRSDAWA